MTFYVGHNLELLFDSWQINTAEGKHHLLTLHLKFFIDIYDILLAYNIIRKEKKSCKRMSRWHAKRYANKV